MFAVPEISPYIFKIGPIGPTWYGLMYVVGFVLGYLLALRYAKKGTDFTEQDVSDLVTYIFFGVILGGRIGYVLFYQFNTFLADPVFLLKITEGGMSFHGGLLGVTLAMFMYALKKKKPLLVVSDFVAPLIPIGLFFGRIGNFINGELWGRETSYWFGVYFPRAGGTPRHPSPLYEAFLEGLILFIILWFCRQKVTKQGQLTGLFLLFYGLFRCLVELVREPDAQLGYLAFSWLTMGQVLSLPMIALGIYLLFLNAKAGPVNQQITKPLK